jgi:hypothetical protein
MQAGKAIHTSPPLFVNTMKLGLGVQKEWDKSHANSHFYQSRHPPQQKSQQKRKAETTTFDTLDKKHRYYVLSGPLDFDEYYFLTV